MDIIQAASIGLHQPAESIALLVAFLKTSMPRAQIMRWLALFSAVGKLVSRRSRREEKRREKGRVEEDIKKEKRMGRGR